MVGTGSCQMTGPVLGTPINTEVDLAVGSIDGELCFDPFDFFFIHIEEGMRQIFLFIDKEAIAFQRVLVYLPAAFYASFCFYF